MISDVLLEAIAEIERYQRTSKSMYSEPSLKKQIESVKSAMQKLLKRLDTVPDKIRKQGKKAESSEDILGQTRKDLVDLLIKEEWQQKAREKAKNEKYFAAEKICIESEKKVHQARVKAMMEKS
jgi:hypothetical protein